MTGSSDWFPTPPPKPLQPTSTAKLALGALVIVLAIAGAGVALSGVGHSSHEAPTTVPRNAAVRTNPTPEDRRAAFQECMKSMGAGSGFSGGRFGRGGPSRSFRDAYGVCRSLLQTGALDPVAPGRTGTIPAPAA